MGISNSDMPVKGDVIHGKLGTYVLQSKIGNGGNGTVFDVKIKDIKSDLLRERDNYVIKILTLGNKSREIRNKREERFRREVRTVQQIDDLELDVVPIIDSYLDVNDYTREWYLMPKGTVYKDQHLSTLSKLKELRTLGNTIVQLHKSGVCHRDIKPSNLLYYKNRCCLTDFGLVWNVSDIHITAIEEAVGPVSIRPPEMEYNVERLRQQIDYQKVDVYLFVKTIWIILTGNPNGFRGEYNRSDLTVYLDRRKLNLGQTVEPLHMMMEKATLESNQDRITMVECLSYIDQQIRVAEGQDMLANSLAYTESMFEVMNQITPDKKMFNDPNKIQIALTKMENMAEVTVDDFGESVSLGLLIGAELVLDDIFALRIKNNFAIRETCRNRKLYVRIKQMEIGRDYFNKIRIAEYSESLGNETIVYGIGELRNTFNSKVGLSGNYTLSLIRHK